MAVCATCNSLIVGKCVSVLGKTYHPGHFLCHVCLQPITDKIIRQLGGKPICKKDYEEMCPICDVCHQPILENHIFFQDKHYHAEHFVCHMCRTQIATRGFHCKKKKIICHACYMRKIAHACRRCGLPIEDRTIIALGYHWHPGCFKCTKCDKIIRTKNYKATKEMEPICGECHADGKLTEYLMSTRLVDAQE